MKEESSSFLKRSRKLLSPRLRQGPAIPADERLGRTCARPHAGGQIKVFCFFFSKKKALLPCFILTACGQAALAQIPGQDPNWPCAQRLVAVLTPGSYWAGSIQANTGWRDDDKIFPLATDIVNRDTPDDEALATLHAYARDIPAEQRPPLFSALVDETNDERTLLIRRIEQLGLRQRRMGDVVADISTKVDEMPASDPHRPDLVGERDFDVRAFQETQRTMRYACEAPASMERRLGAFAKVLQEK